MPRRRIARNGTSEKIYPCFEHGYWIFTDSMREEIVNTSYYHVYNRGVDRRRVFEASRDYEHFLESLYLFNDERYRHRGGDPTWKNTTFSCHEILDHERVPLVSIISYILMPNHFHLLLKQKKDGGISKFLQRLGMGHTKYYNLKHHRTGRLFESSFKSKPLDFEEHLYHIPRYIHLNALDGKGLDWRKGRLEDWKKAKALLQAFPWSSHHTYVGQEQPFPILDESAIRALFPPSRAYWDYLNEWSGRHNMPLELED